MLGNIICALMLGFPQLAPATPVIPLPPQFLYVDQRVPQLQFAATEIRSAHAACGLTLVERPLAALAKSDAPAGIILLASSPGDAAPSFLKSAKLPLHSSPQSYAIRRLQHGAKTFLAVLGSDPTGALYGGLDLAEALRLGQLDELSDSDHTPAIIRRGIKFNIPLDLRTPSYSDCSDAAQANIPEMWSLDFWRDFLDEMARHRYNVLTLWSLHPFPSMVKVPEYPDVALDDVQRTTLSLDNTFSFSGSDMTRPEMLEQAEVVKHITIDQKIAFWRQVMQLADDRGIEVYLFTWNIFTFGAEGKYGITPSQDNEATIAYFRASVRETILTYPLLAGIGITTGEQMKPRDDQYAKEPWLWRTYGLGILDALALQPDRKVRLIHRFHMTGQSEILEAWKDYPQPIDLSFKYAIAHMYSSPSPPFLKPIVPQLPEGQRLWLTVRNDDIYSFRWCDPTYVREFLSNLPGPEVLAGFYMGPDGTIWGRETLSRTSQTPPELEIQKHWLSFMLWGRLSYEPTLPDSLIEHTLATRFPEVADSAHLLQTWSQASRIIPQITRFFWGDIDLKWFPEACLSHPRHKGFYTIRHFMEGDTMPASGIATIRQWREDVVAGRKTEGLTPLDVAQVLETDAKGALEKVASLRPHASPGSELDQTLTDLQCMAYLGLYYADKIRAAAALGLYDRDNRPAEHTRAIELATSAANHWKHYAATYDGQYKPALRNRVGLVDLPALQAEVDHDIEIASTWKPGTIPPGAGRRAGGDQPFRP